MQLKEAELLFHANALEIPIIQKTASGNDWIVTLNGAHQLKSELEIQRAGIRIFKRLDVAVGVLFEVGFEEIKIVKLRKKI